jgi:hypothetical protein
MREIELTLSVDEADALSFYLQRAREYTDSRGQAEIDRLTDLLDQAKADLA